MIATALSPETKQMAKTSAEAGFRALLEAHQRTLHKVAYIYCRDIEERRDLIQEMAIQLWRSFDRFDGRASASTWAYRVAMNVAISHRRREGRRPRADAPLETGLNVADASSALDSRDDGSQILHALIDGLDEINRGVVLLYLDGFDHAEIADTLGTTAGNVGTRLGRIRLKLQRQLGSPQQETTSWTSTT